jgi:glutaredoxin
MKMKSALRSSLLVWLLYAAGAHAQLYKWVGPDGKITYSDTPPPATAKQVERKNLQEGGISTANLPFELAEAVKNNPVTLYTTAKCAACDAGRRLLTGRGIPFREKTVTTNDDIAKLHEAGGESQLPFLVAGRSKQQGFEPGAWNSLLTAAGYPESNILPRSYQGPKAEAAAPAPVAANSAATTNGTQAQSAEDKRTDDLPPATGNAPPGFRF